MSRLGAAGAVVPLITDSQAEVLCPFISFNLLSFLHPFGKYDQISLSVFNKPCITGKKNEKYFSWFLLLIR